jgi:tripartite-type tricarboxylate transporter receptor subunit TctC
VPYTSAAQIYPDLIEGRVDVIMDNLPNVLPFAQKGQLRPVAVVTSSRVDVMPDVPTVSETALPDFEMGAWTGLVGPKGLPPGVVATLSTALKAAVRSPEFQKWLQTFGAIQSTQLEPQEFAQFIRKELAVWKSAAEQSGVATPR